jgi:hypothetical protein
VWIAGVVALVELVAAAELAAARVPQRFHDLDALSMPRAAAAALFQRVHGSRLSP